MSEFEHLVNEGLAPDENGEWQDECDVDTTLHDALQCEEAQMLDAVECDPAPEEWPPVDADGHAIIADE